MTASYFGETGAEISGFQSLAPHSEHIFPTFNLRQCGELQWCPGVRRSDSTNVSLSTLFALGSMEGGADHPERGRVTFWFPRWGSL